MINLHMTRQVCCRDVTELTLALGQLLDAKMHLVDMKSEVVITGGRVAALLTKMLSFLMNFSHMLP